MKILFLPNSRNPYQHLLAEALAAYQAQVQHSTLLPSEIWLFRHRHEFQILHIHWPTGVYKVHRHPFLTPLRFARFVQKLVVARLLGYRIVWTVHNLMPHEGTIRAVDLLGRRALIRLSNALIVHCKWAQDEVARIFGRSHDVFVIPMGHYRIYPVHRTRVEVRRMLEICPNAFVFLLFGQLRHYKGIRELLDAFQRVQGRDAVLLIAGRCGDAELESLIVDAMRRDERIKCHLRFIGDDEVSEFILAADVMVAPFTKVLTSSSVVVGLSYGLPIVAPALGCLPELLGPECSILYDHREPAGLVSAMNEIRQRNLEAMAQAALKVAENLEWKTIAEKTYRVYKRPPNMGMEEGDNV